MYPLCCAYLVLFFRRSLCRCDEKFYACLHLVNSTFADNIAAGFVGYVYFTFLQDRCFEPISNSTRFVIIRNYDGNYLLRMIAGEMDNQLLIILRIFLFRNSNSTSGHSLQYQWKTLPSFWSLMEKTKWSRTERDESLDIYVRWSLKSCDGWWDKRRLEWMITSKRRHYELKICNFADLWPTTATKFSIVESTITK